jgi:hypothetical protein
MSPGASTAHRTLSEAASKQMLASHGVPFAPEHVVATAPRMGADAATLRTVDGLEHLNVGDGIAHKTERGLVRLSLGDAARRGRGSRPPRRATADDGEVTFWSPHAARDSSSSPDRPRPAIRMTILLGVGGVLPRPLPT